MQSDKTSMEKKTSVYNSESTRVMTDEQLNFKCQSLFVWPLPQLVPTLPQMFSHQLQLVPTTRWQLQPVQMHFYWTSFNSNSIHHVCKFVLRSIISQNKLQIKQSKRIKCSFELPLPSPPLPHRLKDTSRVTIIHLAKEYNGQSDLF